MRTLRIFAVSTIVLFIVFGVWYAVCRADFSDWHEWASMGIITYAAFNSYLLYRAASWA